MQLAVTSIEQVSGKWGNIWQKYLPSKAKSNKKNTATIINPNVIADEHTVVCADNFSYLYYNARFQDTKEPDEAIRFDFTSYNTEV